MTVRSRPTAALPVERLQRVGDDFTRQQAAEQRLPEDQRRSYTLVLAMRSWLFSAFPGLLRERAQ